MLKVNFQETEIKGSEPHILTEFTMLARNLRKLLAEEEGVEYADEQIAKCVKLSKMTPEELDREILESLNKLVEKLASSLTEEESSKESSDAEPSTGNSAFDDFLKNLFGGGAK